MFYFNHASVFYMSNNIMKNIDEYRNLRQILQPEILPGEIHVATHWRHML